MAPRDARIGKPTPGAPSKTLAAAALAMLLDLTGLAALAALTLLFVNLDETQPFLYPWGLALTALATAACVGVIAHPAPRLFPRLLGLPPLRWLGTRSYGVYLWHWPVIALTRPGLDVPIDGMPLLALRIAATLLLAECSYRLVETPVRSGALSRAWRSLRTAPSGQRRTIRLKWAGALTAALLLALPLANAVAQATPPPPPAYLQVADVTANSQPTVEVAPPSPTAIEPSAPVAQAEPPTQPLPTTEQPTATPVIPPTEPPPTELPPTEPPRLALAPTEPPTAAPTEAPPTQVPPTAVPTRRATATRKPTLTREATSTRTPASTPTSGPDTTPTEDPAETAIAALPSDQTPVSDIDPLSGASILAPVPTQPAQDPQPAQPTQPAQQTRQTPTPQPTGSAVARSPYTGTVTAIGDSVMLGAVTDLRRAFSSITIDAVKGRQLSQGITELKSLLSSGDLGDLVIIHLGSNGTFSARNFDDIMRAAGTNRRVLFLNDKVPRRWESTNNDVITAGVKRYPNAQLVDWRSASVSIPNLLYTDGTHLRASGSRVYTNLLVKAVGP